ncbi:CDP-diacylglycerol--serine O-phosphatidyltransferase [Sulfitobacter sp. D35]|uniref:CDP-diacylglycerol--serine O-phosphatidyltransferase n=1 Tax=Sulfitobacter sp. D35 TaxID=3083252 RepID=UPI00296E74D8|nr:CDP-diacylglycerol--serine O-phosphatidyltransferase [Sulfitobacter sp. D35]MDW4496840.1 CDP-diacylglycerol--serine O-phosphatidyltransferase [Sulfitobacter sp. D35]
MARRDIPLTNILPNLMTVTAICAGLTAIRYGLQGNFEFAVLLILLAAILDGLDGRLARLLDSDSAVGAELDSLADFLNFGVAPGLLLYFWALSETPRLGWIAVLIYAVCCVLRLARFNVSAKSGEAGEDAYFVGVPSPAGAMLVLLPMFVSFAFDSAPFHGHLLSLYMAIIGALLISKVPTWSFKRLHIPQDRVRYILVAFAFAGAAVLTYPWITLVVGTLGYVGVVIWSLVRRGRG